MSTTADEIIGLATNLLQVVDGVSPDEATLRCSTSRAYYAALHAADRSLPDDLTVTAEQRRGRSSHQAIIDAVVRWAKSTRPGRTEAITVARNLPKLRDARKNADYNMRSDFTLDQATAALRIAVLTVQSATRAAERSLTKQA